MKAWDRRCGGRPALAPGGDGRPVAGLGVDVHADRLQRLHGDERGGVQVRDVGRHEDDDLLSLVAALGEQLLRLAEVDLAERLGAGLGLLIADRIPKDRRKKIALPLLAVGVLSTIPLAIDVIRKARANSEPAGDPLETLEIADGANRPETPAEQLEQSQVIEIIEQELARLPERQRQAFIMRYWEELDVAETAKAMGCSEGSVKTHCSRATHALASALKARGITL